MKGPLIILSGPAGSGKTTVISRLLETGLPLRLSVSATTRRPRPGEKDGIQYHFWSRERFVEEKEADAFLEWAEVHGEYYGTLKREVEPYREQGQGVILDIDVQGAEQIRRLCPDGVSVFLRAPTPDTYEQRLRRRATEDEAAIGRRLATARRELERATEYDYQVINDDLDAAVARLREIVSGLMQRENHAG